MTDLTLPPELDSRFQDALSPAERLNSSILVVEKDTEFREVIRTTLKELGYSQIVSVADHIRGLEKFQERKFTHVVFDARKTNMPVSDFLNQIMKIDPEIVAIPASYDPTIDDVFDLVVDGARGYLVKPFQKATLEEAIVLATKAPPLNPAIAKTKDRNRAFSIIVFGALDDLTTIIRQARRYETAKRELPLQIERFRRTAEMGRQFKKGTLEDLLNAYIEYALEVASGPATKMGRRRANRKRRRTTRLRIPTATSDEPKELVPVEK